MHTVQKSLHMEVVAQPRERIFAGTLAQLQRTLLLV
jgi:hypothetical protein